MRDRARVALLLLALTLAATLTACDAPAPDAADEPAATDAPDAAQSRPQGAPEPPGSAPTASAPATPAGAWTGDYEGMKDRRLVRMLVAYSKTFYFIDKRTQRGETYELGMLLEKALNAKNKDRVRPIRVVFIPTSRDELLPGLAAGRGDIASQSAPQDGGQAAGARDARRRESRGRGHPRDGECGADSGNGRGQPHRQLLEADLREHRAAP